MPSLKADKSTKTLTGNAYKHPIFDGEDPNEFKSWWDNVNATLDHYPHHAHHCLSLFSLALLLLPIAEYLLSVSFQQRWILDKKKYMVVKSHQVTCFAVGYEQEWTAL